MSIPVEDLPAFENPPASLSEWKGFLEALRLESVGHLNHAEAERKSTWDAKEFMASASWSVHKHTWLTRVELLDELLNVLENGNSND